MSFNFRKLISEVCGPKTVIFLIADLCLIWYMEILLVIDNGHKYVTCVTLKSMDCVFKIWTLLGTSFIVNTFERAYILQERKRILNLAKLQYNFCIPFLKMSKLEMPIWSKLDLQLLSGQDNSRANGTNKMLCGVGSAQGSQWSHTHTP